MNQENSWTGGKSLKTTGICRTGAVEEEEDCTENIAVAVTSSDSEFVPDQERDELPGSSRTRQVF
jgi:hypothetical protein